MRKIRTVRRGIVAEGRTNNEEANNGGLLFSVLKSISQKRTANQEKSK